MEKQQSIYDLAGIGIGPFNLGLRPFGENPELNAVFFEKKGEFNWHEGMLLEGQRCKCRSLPIWLARQM